MRNVRMIRTEPGLVWIRLEKAVYCETCETVSTSSSRAVSVVSAGGHRIDGLALPEAIAVLRALG